VYTSGREFLLHKNVATAYNHGHPRPKMYIRVHFWAASLQANLLLRGTTAVLGGSEIPFAVSLLKIDGADTRREHKLTAGVSLIR